MIGCGLVALGAIHSAGAVPVAMTVPVTSVSAVVSTEAGGTTLLFASI